MPAAQTETPTTTDPIEASLLQMKETMAETTRQLAELNDKLDAIIEHQGVSYEPMGFLRE